MNRKRKAKYMTTFPRNTVTGAPQNFRQRVSRKAALRPRSPSPLSASASSSALRPKEAMGSGETGTRGPELAHAHHCPSAGSHPLPRPQSRLFSVSRLSSSCRSSGPVLRGASSLRAHEPLRDRGRAPEAPARPRAPGQQVHCRGMRGGGRAGATRICGGEGGRAQGPHGSAVGGGWGCATTGNSEAALHPLPPPLPPAWHSSGKRLLSVLTDLKVMRLV